MLTSNQMRHLIAVALALILLNGGVCSGLCFAQTSRSASHSCCHHGKSHCGHEATSVDGHAAVATVNIAPVVLSAPLISRTLVAAVFEPAPPQFRQFSPPIKSSVLRL